MIWTRSRREPLERGGGMPRAPVEVDWAVAADERLRQSVPQGAAPPIPNSAMPCTSRSAGSSRRATITTASPSAASAAPTGRARTLPARGAAVAQLRFGVAGCQQL